jgi:hypothetical protein
MPPKKEKKEKKETSPPSPHRISGVEPHSMAREEKNKTKKKKKVILCFVR